MRSCCVFDSLRFLHFPLFAVYLLSYRPVFPSGHQLHRPRCGGQIPCALQLMRTLALLPSTTLSHFPWLQQKSEIRTFFNNCLQNYCLFDTFVEDNPNKHGQGKMSVLPKQRLS